MDMSEILIEPRLSEKTTALRELDPKKYVFKVHPKANKIMIRYAVNALFKVNATSCRIINVRGKAKSNRAISRASFKRGVGRSSSWKKAVVTLSKGESIVAVEGA